MNRLKKVSLFISAILIAASVLISGCGKIRIGVKEEGTAETKSYEGLTNLEFMDGVWTYVDDEGNPDLTFNGIAENEYGSWYVQDGAVNFLYSGPICFNGRYYIIINGKNIS